MCTFQCPAQIASLSCGDNESRSAAAAVRAISNIAASAAGAIKGCSDIRIRPVLLSKRLYYTTGYERQRYFSGQIFVARTLQSRAWLSIRYAAKVSSGLHAVARGCALRTR